MPDSVMEVLRAEEAVLRLPAGMEGAGVDAACLHQLFEGRADAEPGATALVDGEARFSYRELERRSNRLAHRLRELGAGPETRVAVCLDRTAELIVALLAVLKAGAAYVPIDPVYPRERQALLLTDSRPAVLVSQERLLGRLPEVTPTVCVDRDRGELARRSEARPAAAAMPSNLAYLIYTSGSTGRPKAVAIEHRSAVARMRWAARMFSRGEMAGMLASTSVCFDLSVFEIFATLAVGGTLILAENALALPSLPAAGEVTLVNTVPSAAVELARGGMPSAVRVVNLAGEPLRRALVERLYALGHVEKVYNLYGPSEDTTYSTWALMRPADPLPPAIGVPLDGTRTHLLDREMRPAAAGEEGELYLGGAGLSRGYLGRPELTAQRYVPDPFAASPGERLYATGDLARLRPSGELDYLGRIDFQVKIRGFRVELGEVEAALDRAPGVADAVVVAREVESRTDVAEKVLVAYVVPSPGTPVEVAALRAHLQASLTDAMVPAYFVALPELPLSPNGKVDRKSLPAPDLTAAPEAWVAPRTPLEETLAGIWAEVLGLPRVGVEDHFFALGGHSLLAYQVVSRLREALGVELPMTSLFERPTVAKLAESLAAALGAGEALAALRIEPVPRDAPLPLSYAQQRLWYLEQLAPGSPVYNLSFRLSLAGPLDASILEGTLGEIVRRHEALRTTFPRLRGEPYQAISPAAPFFLPIVDLAALAAPAGEREIEALVDREAHRLFDLETGPLFLALLLRVERQRHILLLTMHHIISDGWSMDVLPRELRALYEAFAAGRPSPLPDLPVQYADFAVWQRHWLRGGTLERQLEYWRRQLAGAPEGIDLPTDFPRPAIRGFRGANRSETLTLELSEELRACCRREGVTLFMLLLAGFDVLLARYSAQEDLLVWSPVANRTRAEVEEMIGFFVNTLVLRADLGAVASFRSLLRQVRETALGAYGHQDLPFEMLVEDLRPGRDLSRHPFSQVMLVLENLRELPDAGGLQLGIVEDVTATAKLDLTLFVVEGGAALRTRIEYNTDLYEPATIRRLLGHLGRLLGAATEDLERGWRDLPLLSAAEREQLLVGFNDSGAAAGPDLCMHELFEAQAARIPDETALVAPEGVRLTYRELNEKAERLARRLRALGLGPERLAGVLLERTADLIVTLLAVLKAGGAYAPLDPNYPQQRVLLMLETARARVLVTRRRLAESLGEELPAGMSTVLLDAGWEEEPEPVPPAQRALPDNLAYLIFTSGSTGVPKGVAIQHRSAVAMLRWARTLYTPAEYAGMLASTSICFDMSVFEIFGALAEGGKLLVAENALALPDLVAKDEVVLIDTVPSAMAELLRIGRLPASVRTVNLGGEPLKGSLVREIYDKLPGVERVVNLYGPSEDTTFTSYAVVPRETDDPLIGRPVSGESAYVLDAGMRPVPIGVPGALYMGGTGVTRGYLHRPDLTAERYIPNPYGPPGSRLYRVGDLVRVLPAGELDFLGRLDHQVKVRGFRIELGEIESALVRHGEVREAAVLAVPEVGGAGNRLIAFVETDSSPELRAYLKQSLPDYMVPSQFVVLPELPLTPNGKIDRRALAALPLAAESAAVAGERAPRSYAEEVLAGIWSELFGRPVGVNEDFFDLGGHSLLATRVASQVREAFGIELPVRRLFEQPTVAELARGVEAALGAGGVLEAPHIEPQPRRGPLPLSFAQRRLWFLDQLAPGSAVYNIPYPLSLGGKLDAAALAAALTGLVCRHEALRTTFISRDGEPQQEIAPAGAFPLPIVDLEGLGEPLRSAEAAALVASDAARPFDLGAGPLLRATLVRLAAERHTLLLTMHHIVSDAWSMDVLLREMASLYETCLAGGAAPLPELPVQYADFAVWQRQWLSGEALRSQLEYWRRQLAGAPAGLDLPTDFPRPAAQTFNGDGRAAELPPDLSARLQAFRRREGVTLFMLLLAGFDVLLARWSGQRDVLVGSPIANRNRTETEGLIGFFVNTLVLRTDLGRSASFRDLLRQVRETALAAYGRQDLPFETLVEELHPQRDLSRSPFFQVLLSVETAVRQPPRMGDLALSPVEAPVGTSKFDLSLFVADAESGIAATVEYNTDLYEGATVRRLLGHLERLLDAAAAEPERSWRDLPLLSESEREQLLVGFNDSGPTEGPDLCLHELFEAQVSRIPDETALVAPEGLRLTYRELDERAERLARRLRALGLGPEMLAGVLLDRRADLIVTLLAVLKAGGAYAPLDPRYPEQRVRVMLETARAAVLVSRRELAAALPAGLPAIYLDAGWEEEPAAESDERPAVLPDNLAYVIFTSGSTGVPKGVAIQHRSAVAMLRWARTIYSAAEYGGMLGSTSICFDMSVFEIFGTLAEGGKLLLAENALALPELASKEEVVLVDTVPSAMAELLRLGRLPSSIRTVNLGGEPLKAALVAEIYEKLPDVERVVNLYGPSEDTTFTSYAIVPRGAAHPLIGRPVAGEAAYVLDAEMRPVPIGIPGALYMGGEGVTRGYLHRPELTAERYIPNPYGPPGARLYTVGDLVRVLPTGELDFLGRLDHQVKVRGFRIELGEIESALVRHAEVREAAVLAVPEPDGAGNRLIAFVEADRQEREFAGDLRAYLKQGLPEYMVPSRFVLLPELPLTPNGKIDRRALAALPLDAESAAAAGERAPRGYAEEVLAGIWSEIFGRAVGIGENFFDLGGHSLLATRVISRVREAFAVELPVRRLFEQPTIAGLAASVEAALAAGGAVEAPRIEPAPREGQLPLSFAQHRLWFLDQLSPGSAVYNIPYPLSVEGELDQAILEECLQEVMRRHEALRTTFPSADGEPYQAIAPAGSLSLPVVDLAGLAAPARDRETAALLERESARPFDLAAGPLFRAALLALAPQRHVLLLAMHHIVADGWSLEVLLRELAALYDAFAAGRPSPLPELPVQYADFAVWQRRWLSGEALARQLAYWRRQLADAPAGLDLPADFPRPAVQTFNGATFSAELPAELSVALLALCRREGVTLFMLLLAGLDVLLARWSGQQDVLVGSPIAGRNREETEGLIGFFVNTLVLRSVLPAEVSFRDLLGQVRENALSAYNHQDLPFELLVEELRPERDLSRPPLVQALLAVENASAPSQPARLRLAPLALAETTAKFDLALSAQEVEGRLALAFNYNTDLFAAPTVRRLAAHLQALLRGLAADPEAGIWRQPLLAPGERHQLLVEWNDALPAAEPRGVVERFAAQVQKTPHAVALKAPGGRLSYAELDRQANRLAHRLRRLGVRRETTVGLFAERSAEMVIGLLGIWKAGGAYLPLDPGYPPARLAYLLEDSQAPVIAVGSGLAEALLPHGCRTVPLDAADLAEESDLPPEGTPGAGDLAYQIYTSGTTGQPKAVQVEHGQLAATLGAVQEAFGFGVGDRMPCIASNTFDIFLLELLGMLLSGGTCVLLPLRPALDLERLAGELETATLLHAVPALMRQVLEAVRQRGTVTPRLRAVFTGGDAVPVDLLTDLRAVLPEVEVWVLYGPTEAAIVCSAWPVHAGEAMRPLLGRPLPGTELRVCDAAGEPVPIGVAGEIWIGGAAVTRGYWQREELTAEKFTRAGGRRFYRSGDLARRLPDGTLEFLGRVDQQVKVRGFRIELGEVEAALASHPAVTEAAVLALPDPTGTGNRLIAYVAGQETGAASGLAAELRAYLARTLPDYMVPSLFVRLDELPLTPNGKIDRRALAARPLPEAGAAADRAPRGYVEEVLSGIWSGIFGRAVGPRDNFFDLGGHSLLATRAVSRLRSALGVELPLQQVFATPTVEALADWIEREIAARRGVPLPPIERAGRDGELPLSFGQQRLWLLDRLEPGTATFNLPAPLRLAGRLDAAALAGALAAIVERHESLRSVFAEREGRGCQRVLPAVPLFLPVADLGAIPLAAREAEAQRLLDEEARLPFDLTRAPLLRTTLLRLAPDEHLLLVTLHHIVTDGWSTAVFAREVAALYEAAVTGRPSPLPGLPFQYPDFALWQRRALDGETVSTLLARWKERFGTDVPALRLPIDRPRPAVQTASGGYRYIVLPPDLTQSVRGLARASGATLFMTLLAAFQALLARYSGQEKIVVGSPVAGRDRAELEGLIGFFVNTLVLPADVSGDPTFAELLERVRGMVLEAYACQALPFEKLVEDLQPQRDRGRNPLFRVMFSLQNDGEAAAGGAAGLTLSPVPATNGTSQFDLTLAIDETPERLWAVAEYDAGMFDAAAIELLLEHYRRLLAAAVAEPATRVSALPPAPEELPRPLPEPVLAAAAAPAPDVDARRDRLAARMSKLTAAQREALEQRRRGVS